MLLRELGLSIREHDESRRRSIARGEMSQQMQRRTISPVQVIEDEQQRTARRYGVERLCDGLEQPRSRTVAVAERARILILHEGTQVRSPGRATQRLGERLV